MSVGRKASLVLVSNVAGAAMGYLTLLVIGRYFAPSAYGLFLFAASVTGLAALVSNLGIGAAHQRQVAQGLDLATALGTFVRIRAAVGAALLALFGLGYLAWTVLLGRELTDATTPAVLGLAVVMQVLSGSRQVLLDTWQGQQRVHRVELLRQVDTALLLLLMANAGLMVAHLEGRWEPVPGVGAFWAGVLGIDGALTLPAAALLIAGCYTVSKAVSLGVGWAWSWRDRVRMGPWDPALARSYLRFAVPFALTGALVLVLQTTDTLMLGFFWTSREVGLYGTAQKLAGLGLLAASAAGAVMFPRFAQLHAAGDGAREAQTFVAAQRYLLLLVVPVAAALAALPREGLHVAVGDAYLDAAGPLRLLALWAVVVAAEQPMTSRLMGQGRAHLLVRSAGLNAAVNVALNLVFIPTWGLGMGPTGAALATLVSTALSYVYVRALSRRLHGIPWVDLHQVRIALAGVSVWAFWWAMPRLLGPGWFDRVWELAGWGLVGVAGYVAMLFVVRELHGRDLRFLRRVAHPSELLAELRGR